MIYICPVSQTIPRIYLTMTELQRPTLTLPADGKRLLLHSCCAPCSGEVMEAITASGIMGI